MTAFKQGRSDQQINSCSKFSGVFCGTSSLDAKSTSAISIFVNCHAQLKLDACLLYACVIDRDMTQKSYRAVK